MKYCRLCGIAYYYKYFDYCAICKKKLVEENELQQKCNDVF